MTLPPDATLAKIIMRHEWAASRGIANVCTGDIENLLWLLLAERAKSEGLRRIVDQQAEDDGLWFKAETAAEAYVQQELRKLHAAVEALSTSPSPTPQQDAPLATGDASGPGSSPSVEPRAGLDASHSIPIAVEMVAIIDAARSYRAAEADGTPRMWRGKALQDLANDLDDKIASFDAANVE